MKLGYAFPFRSDPNYEMQNLRLHAAGCADVIMEDGQNSDAREQLKDALTRMSAGDTLVVDQLASFASSITGLSSVLTELSSRKLELVSLSDEIDTTKPCSFYDSMAVVRKFSETCLIERLQAGRSRLSHRGEKLGRKPKMSADQIDHARQLLKLGESGRSVARTFGVSEATVYRRVRQA